MAVFVFGLSWCAAVGCQCSPLFEPYAGLIDGVSDIDPTLDPLYHPAWDLNRIGKPDWCTSPVNRFLCRRACRYPDPVCPPGYVPVYADWEAEP